MILFVLLCCAPPWTTLFPYTTLFRSELGGFLLGRRLYETMLVWDTDPSMRETEAEAAFADVWCAIPKVVFSRTLDSVQRSEEHTSGLQSPCNLVCRLLLEKKKKNN